MALSMEAWQQGETKRALIFSLTYVPFIGGAELAVKETTDRISPERIHFDMVTLRGDAKLPATEQIGNVTVHRIGPSKLGITFSELGRFPWYLIKILYIPLAMFKARELSRTKKYDTYWCLMTNMGFIPVLLKMFFKDATPFILTLQDGDTKEHIMGRLRIKMVRPLFKRIFTQAAAIHTISHFLAMFAKELGYPGVPIVVPNGVNYALFADPAWKREAHRLIYRFDKKPNEYYLVTTSRLTKKNAVDDIIRALALLPERYKFLVLGEGPMAEELWKLAEKLNVAKRIMFIGHVPYDQIPAYLAIADVFVRPSLSEGMGNSFIEAMAARVPVVATPVGGIPDFLFDPDISIGDLAPTGVFCKVRNPRSIAQAVERIIDNEKLRNRLIENAQELAERLYDWNLIAHDMEQKVFEPVFSIQK
jgi:glycosyltransferase involved in cell wall biosynthesis